MARVVWPIGLGLLLSLVLLSASPANAGVTGPCTGSLNGVDATDRPFDKDNAIPVQEGTSVPWEFVSTGGAEIVSWYSTLHYGPFSAPLDSGDDPADDEEEDTSKGGSAPVDNYAWMGVGLYHIEGGVGLEGGGECVVDVYVLVEGNPLTTVLGGGAAVATVAGTAGLGAAGLAGFKAAAGGLV